MKPLKVIACGLVFICCILVGCHLLTFQPVPNPDSTSLRPAVVDTGVDWSEVLYWGSMGLSNLLSAGAAYAHGKRRRKNG